MKKILFSTLIILCTCFIARADEGMWIPMLLKYNIADMNAKGFKLTADDLYNINSSSLKDAVVGIRGCTAELISDDGLIITNHHCGYGQIQSHSSIEHDYLTDGFWAMSRDKELSNRGSMEARFLIRMTDVTDKALTAVKDNLIEEERTKLIASNIKAITDEAKANEPNYTHSITAMFNGNQYVLFTYEVYKDVRLVGAPPSAIGKFGGDTDNWMWPRHTGDFTLFRIYAGKDNKPAEYSIDNVPYKPKCHFKISLKGVNEGDFTLVYGYPGTTQEYLPSYAIQNVIELSNPHKIALRDMRLNLMNDYMKRDDKVRIQYASKNAGVANAWKKWIGEKKGLERLDAVGKKQIFEAEFTKWLNTNTYRKKQYGDLLSQFKQLYTDIRPYSLATDYYNEAFRAIEMVSFIARFSPLINELKKDNPSAETINRLQKALKSVIEDFYKDYHMPYDKQIFGMMLNQYYINTPEQFRAEAINKLHAEYNGDFTKLADKFYAETHFADTGWGLALANGIDKYKVKEIETDSFYQLWKAVTDNYTNKVQAPMGEIAKKLAVLQRTYMKGQMEMQPNGNFYPDANSTLRVTYGKVEGFRPLDGVIYDYYSTIEGVIEKGNMGIYDYVVPTKLKKLWQNKDYGDYAMKNGQMPVCFIASNHTSGGNSGSPLLNANGELVGINFDRCWESTMSDYMFDPNYCRNISVDIRYVLFIIDKYAEAKHLINEMTIVK
ncbi:MAG: S46 family peptidase [Prevotellaceae bacterium]|jgi:predicted nucleotidyltransferase|nr:S46 family peptidase [Prevotellaceae bacterium]